MHKLLLFVLLFSPLAAEVVLAQANAINVVCVACRDPHEYPEDFANFAFNQFYGPDAWMSFDQADDFFITNLNNQTVYADADFVLLGFGFEGFRVPFWPTNLVRITLALPNGELYTAFRSVFRTSLPVGPADDGAQSGAGGHTPSGGSDGGDDEDDEYDGYDEYDEYDWDDLEFDDYEGSTWIEDPDEDGNFDDTEWCEEC